MSIPSDNDQHQDPEPRAWVVRAGRDGAEEQHNLDHSVVSIGFDNWGEGLHSFANREEFGKHLEDRIPDQNYWRSSRDQIWRFGREIEVDDLVVMPQKRPELYGRRLIAIGRVVGPYENDPSQPEDTWQRRKVEWLKTDLPREVVQDDLSSSMDASSTVFSLSRNDAPYRIKYLAEHGEDPGDRHRSVDNDQAEIWEERWNEYQNHLNTKGHTSGTIDDKWSVLRRWFDYALECGQSPVAFDEPLLEEFLSDQGDLIVTTRQTYASHIRMWCEYWDGQTPGFPRNTDTRSLQERLEGAAEELLCDVNDLQEIVYLLEDKGQVILYGPPGTGKTYLPQVLAEALAPEEQARSLVQFHPAYSYEDFFEGYRPVTDGDKQMTYELTPGPLAKLAEHASDNPEQQHVMVIDEINRANLPRVLGELLFLLEYRDKSIQVMHRSDDSFNLPENLWFIGTMNTADRSIALIDAAMRRRFHFVPFFAERGPTENLLRKWTQERAPAQAWVVDLVSAVNSELKKELGGDHLQLGPSHFMKTDLDDGGFERVWKYNIEPFIEDQLFGKPDKIARFRLKAVLERHRPDRSEESTFDSSSGGEREVSTEMRETPFVRGLEERLGDQLKWHPDKATSGYLRASDTDTGGFSLRTSRSEGDVSLLNIQGNRRERVNFPAKELLLKNLKNKREEVDDYANMLLVLGLNISDLEGRQQDNLPLSDVLEALDQISECVAALA